MFENPTILWIDRKSESVVMSCFKQRWNYESRLEEFDKKSKTELIKEYSNKFKRINDEKKNLQPYNFHQLFYEDLISDPLLCSSGLCQDLKLEMYNSQYKKIKNWNIYKGSNEAYKKTLNKEELKFLENEICNLAKTLGYK